MKHPLPKSRAGLHLYDRKDGSVSINSREEDPDITRFTIEELHNAQSSARSDGALVAAVLFAFMGENIYP